MSRRPTGAPRGRPRKHHLLYDIRSGEEILVPTDVDIKALRLALRAFNQNLEYFRRRVSLRLTPAGYVLSRDDEP